MNGVSYNAPLSRFRDHRTQPHSSQQTAHHTARPANQVCDRFSQLRLAQSHSRLISCSSHDTRLQTPVTTRTHAQDTGHSAQEKDTRDADTRSPASGDRPCSTGAAPPRSPDEHLHARHPAHGRQHQSIRQKRRLVASRPACPVRESEVLFCVVCARVLTHRTPARLKQDTFNTVHRGHGPVMGQLRGSRAAAGASPAPCAASERVGARVRVRTRATAGASPLWRACVRGRRSGRACSTARSWQTTWVRVRVRVRVRVNNKEQRCDSACDHP